MTGSSDVRGSDSELQQHFQFNSLKRFWVASFSDYKLCFWAKEQTFPLERRVLIIE